MVWPASTVEMLVPLNKLPAAPPSVKVGFDPVAVKVGASLTPVTDTVDATESVAVSLPPFAVPPESCTSVRVTTRFDVPGF